MDKEGRITLKSIDDTNNEGGLKWKRKSELSKQFSISNKSRISIKGNNQYEYLINEEDPFNISRASKLISAYNNNEEGD